MNVYLLRKFNDDLTRTHQISYKDETRTLERNETFLLLQCLLCSEIHESSLLEKIYEDFSIEKGNVTALQIKWFILSLVKILKLRN